MTPAQARIAAASRLEARRNADALGAARERCIADAVDRLVPVLIEGYEFEVLDVRPRPHEPPLARGGAA